MDAIRSPQILDARNPRYHCRPHGRPYFLEVKRVGGRQSPGQKEFQSKAEATGAHYAVVRSIDDVRALGN